MAFFLRFFSLKWWRYWWSLWEKRRKRERERKNDKMRQSIKMKKEKSCPLFFVRRNGKETYFGSKSVSGYFYPSFSFATQNLTLPMILIQCFSEWTDDNDTFRPNLSKKRNWVGRNQGKNRKSKDNDNPCSQNKLHWMQGSVSYFPL